MKWFISLACVSAFFSFGSIYSQDGGMEALLSASCLECHDDATEKGGLSLETIDSTITPENAEIWLRCLEQIERGFMPPAEKAQPTSAEKNAAIEDLESGIVAFFSKLPRPPATLRRLNETEYRNTVRDLLSLNTGSYDPTSEFPADQLSHGFASNGETLVTSGFLLKQQLAAADELISRAVKFGDRPETKTWDLKPPFDRTTKGQIYGEAARYRKDLKIPQPYQSIAERTRGIPKSGYHPVDELNDGVPFSGWYQIRIQVEAKYRHALDQSKFKRFPSMWDETEPIRLELTTATLQGIDPENKEAREFAIRYEQAGQRHIGTWDLPDDELVWLECRAWLDAGHFPRISFPNGPSNSNNRLLTYFKDNAEELLSPEELAEFKEENKKGNWTVNMHFKSPRFHLHQIQVKGPLLDEWPPASHQSIFGKKVYDSEKAENTLTHFAARAWRRPVDKKEIAPFLQLVQEAETNGASPEEAIQEGLKGILCAPEFLFREEKEEALTSFELATRLSYFLWASMPDEELTRAAKSGELSLEAQAERMLKDPKSDAFIEEFLNGWIEMRKLGSMAPDVGRFSRYYADNLEPAMRKETFLFFKQLLHANGSIKNFINSDYTFLNKELAELYKIENAHFVQSLDNKKVAGLHPNDFNTAGEGNSPTTEFARVSLTNALRGGLLGQGSVLTLTANGVDTSPIIRGVWLLENILGTPPTPPPPDIPPIEPDIRGATTIREQLEKHRESKSCRACHAHIDPPGFALESFNAIGEWRGHYHNDGVFPEVDSSGKFDGQEFKDVVEFKAALLGRTDDFARSLVEKLFIYALGRDLGVTDRADIRAILESTKADNYPLKDLVLGVVKSDIFRQK